MNLVKKLKKFKTLFLISLIAITTTSIIVFSYSNFKCKNLDYAIEKYSTSGLFNKHKLYSLENFKIKFSDGSICIAEVNGIEGKSPYKSITYNLHLVKHKSGKWKLSEISPNNN
ncbi:hypothetical protein [Clostridium sp.]|uniref:hypothetical protein n=1 Tax=Clostridium sp. TaxID=1506 RepID=UPI00321708DE